MLPHRRADKGPRPARGAAPAAAPTPQRGAEEAAAAALTGAPPREGDGEERTAALRSRRRDPAGGRRGRQETLSGARPLQSRRTPHRAPRPPHGPSALRTAAVPRMRHHPPGPAPVARGAGSPLVPPCLGRRMRAVTWRLGGRARCEARARRSVRGRACRRGGDVGRRDACC